jgi:pantoate--beta-alanine ligase
VRFAGGVTDVESLEAAGRGVLDEEPEVKVDYFAVIDERTFKRPAVASGKSSAIVAARVGTTRLIDNMSLAAE